MNTKQRIAVAAIAAGLFACQATVDESTDSAGAPAAQRTTSKFELAEVAGGYQSDGSFQATVTEQGKPVASLRVGADGTGKMTFEKSALPARDVTFNSGGNVAAANETAYRYWLMATKQSEAYWPVCGSSSSGGCTLSWCVDGSCGVYASDCVFTDYLTGVVYYESHSYSGGCN